DSYQAFYFYYDAGGAALRPWLDVRAVDNNSGDPDTPPTTVQLNDPPASRTSIISAHVRDYLKLAIDNIFYTLGANVSTVAPGAYQSIYDLVSAVMNGNLRDAAAAGLISNFLAQVILPLADDYPEFDRNSNTPTQPATKRSRTGQTINYNKPI